MEVMTRDMSDVAYKTKTETVSMKIITLVTLFFLPGTFVSVCFFFLLYLVGAYYPVRILGQKFPVITAVPPQLLDVALLYIMFQHVTF